jgi:hypothetical protein
VRARCAWHRNARHVARRFLPDDKWWSHPDFDKACILSFHNDSVYVHGLERSRVEAMRLGLCSYCRARVTTSCHHVLVDDERRIKLKKSWLDIDTINADHLGGQVPIYLGATTRLSMHMSKGDREKYGMAKDRVGTIIVGWECDECEPAHTSDTTHFEYVPILVYVQFCGPHGFQSVF